MSTTSKILCIVLTLSIAVLICVCCVKSEYLLAVTWGIALIFELLYYSDKNRLETIINDMQYLIDGYESRRKHTAKNELYVCFRGDNDTKECERFISDEPITIVPILNKAHIFVGNNKVAIIPFDVIKYCRGKGDWKESPVIPNKSKEK